MRGIDQAQNRTAGAELNLILVEELDAFGDAGPVNERPVEALQIDRGKLAVTFANLGVTARDHGRRRIDNDVTRWIAAQLKDILVEFKSTDVGRLRINQFQASWRG